MADTVSQFAIRYWHEYRFVLVFSIIALVIASIPYIVGVALATEQRVFGGFVYAMEDGYSYLAKMQVGAAGHWLFHLLHARTPP